MNAGYGWIMTADIPQRTGAPNRRRHFLVSFWRGEERLWRAYWVAGVFGSWAVSTLAVLMINAGFLPWQVGIGLAFVYALYAAVVIWRCAPNSNWRWWGIAARTTLVLSFVLAVVRLFGVV